MSLKVLAEIDIPDLTLLRRGKVRDVYDLDNSLLIIATDRISAFDVVLPNPIPEKGRVLTQMSLFWYDFFKEIVPNHLITSNIKAYPDNLSPFLDQLSGRSMIVKKAEPLSIECIVRGYITGSGWNEYQETGSVCGITLPGGLKESEKLPEPIFTPSTKADLGDHDMNINFEEAAELVGFEIAKKAEQYSLDLYRKGAQFALENGIIIADTKFEFGIYEDELILIDEVLTPDSSRFWPLKDYSPGRSQASFDKQYVRDYLKSIHWDKNPPAPNLPADVILNTTQKYLEALERIVKH